MRFVSNRAILMRPLLAALASLSLFSQLCMSGCAVGPSYRRPAATLENFHSVGAHAAHPTRAPASALEAWWDGFNDPMLSRIVQRARDQNLDLAAALARVQQARAAAREAGAHLLPTFDVNGQATRIHYSLESPVGQIAGPLPGFNRNQSIYDAGLSAMWELDLFGGLRRGREATSAEADAAIAEQVGTRISVTADAVNEITDPRIDVPPANQEVGSSNVTWLPSRPSIACSAVMRSAQCQGSTDSGTSMPFPVLEERLVRGARGDRRTSHVGTAAVVRCAVLVGETLVRRGKL
jgi:Outer membrane efflux protein